MNNHAAVARFPLYHALSRLPWPRRFAHKILLVAFFGTHMPLVALLLYLVGSTSAGQVDWFSVAMVLGGTLLGTAVTLLSIQSLLSPVTEVGKALVEFQKSRDLPGFETRYNDEIGELMSNTQNALEGFRQSIEQLEACTQIDDLTSVLNRRGAMERLEKMVDSFREEDRSIVLLFIDLNGFKQLNDRHGHAAGDAVLQKVGRLLRSRLRERDWVARWGGDEFVLTLTSNDRQDIGKLVDRLHEELKAIPVADNGAERVDVGFCVGAAFLQVGMTAEGLVAKADEAMYKVKQNPDIRLHIANPD